MLMGPALLRLLALSATTAALELRAAQREPKEEHFWPHARGTVPGQYGVTDVVVPRDLSSHLKWSWHHPAGRYHTTVAGGPVIDSQKNLYLTTNDGIRKFSPGGKVLWHYMPKGDTNIQPSLMGEAVFGATNNGHAFALDQKSGKELWEHKFGKDAGQDVGYPAAHGGLFIMGIDRGHDPRSDGGNTRMLAVNATTGEKVWEYHVETPVWNVMPLFPGDESVVFMDFTGGVYRLGLGDGRELWHARVSDSEESFSDGGVILGPNGVAYSCSNPGAARGSEGSTGVLRAFRLEDGLKLWERTLPHPCNSWPAVGHLGAGRELSVVVTPGAFMGTRSMHGGIMAFDATTGKPQWQYQAPLYKTWTSMAKGDISGLMERMIFDPKHAICLPAHWSAPSIGGDGAVYAARSDGHLYAVRGPAEDDVSLAATGEASIDFATSPGVQVETFNAGGASLHGSTAFAPGMMAMATCDSLFVFEF